MPFREIIVWLSRATGVGYRRYEPLVAKEVDIKKASDLREKADRLAMDIERLERELRKHGRIRIFPFGNGDD
jgi:hypothetical protein